MTKLRLFSSAAICLLVLSSCDGQDEAARVAAATPTVSVTAEEMIKDYWGDMGAANRKYKDRIVVVEGFIESIERNDDMLSINLDADAAESTEIGSPSVSCDFANVSDMPDVKIGDRIKIKGLCEGKLSTMVMMGYCVKSD